MLAPEDNELLTRVGPGTPMGELLRRYWHPVAAAVQLRDHPVKKVRLLGEDLALFRDGSGRLGLVQETCPHRRASLAYGMTEDFGIRCMYHGWMFDVDGRCVEQPNEAPGSRFKERICVKAYPVQELGGLIFAYLGPQPAPLLPRWDLFVDSGHVVRQVTHTTVPCNWLQIMENSVDPVHVEWAHGRYFNWVMQQKGLPQRPGLCGHHLKIGFDRFEYGIIKRRVLEGGTEEDDDWKIGHPLIFPTLLRVGTAANHTFQIRVPIDDTHTWHLWYQMIKVPDDIPVPDQSTGVPLVEADFTDEDGYFKVDNVNGQDIAAWVTQGPVTDRSEENLCSTDQGVRLYRALLREQLDKVARGEDPIGTLRDPDENRVITVPQESDKFGAGVRPNAGLFRRQGWDYAPEVEAVVQAMTSVPA